MPASLRPLHLTGRSGAGAKVAVASWAVAECQRQTLRDLQHPWTFPPVVDSAALPVDGRTALRVSKEAGELYSWGLNAHGQLGLGDLKPRFTPQRIESVKSTPFADVAAGDQHSAAVERGSGVLQAWGGDGRLHDGKDHVLKPTCRGLAGATGYSFLGLASQHAVGFSQTRVRQIVPDAAPQGADRRLACTWTVVGRRRKY